MKKNKNVSKGTKHPQPKMKTRMSGVSKTAEKGRKVEIVRGYPIADLRTRKWNWRNP